MQQESEADRIRARYDVQKVKGDWGVVSTVTGRVVIGPVPFVKASEYLDEWVAKAEATGATVQKKQKVYTAEQVAERYQVYPIDKNAKQTLWTVRSRASKRRLIEATSYSAAAEYLRTMVAVAERAN